MLLNTELYASGHGEPQFAAIVPAGGDYLPKRHVARREGAHSSLPRDSPLRAGTSLPKYAPLH